MIEKVRLKAQIIWYFPSILNVVKFRVRYGPTEHRTGKRYSSATSLCGRSAKSR